MRMTPQQRKDFLKMKINSIGRVIDNINRTIDELNKMEEYTDLLYIGSASSENNFIILNGMPADAFDSLVETFEKWRKCEQDKRYYLKKELDMKK